MSAIAQALAVVHWHALGDDPEAERVRAVVLALAAAVQRGDRAGLARLAAVAAELDGDAPTGTPAPAARSTSSTAKPPPSAELLEATLAAVEAVAGPDGWAVYGAVVEHVDPGHPGAVVRALGVLRRAGRVKRHRDGTRVRVVTSAEGSR